MLYLKYLSFTRSSEWYKVSGGSPYLSLFTLYAEKALCGSERPWQGWGKTETQTCLEKKTRTVHRRNSPETAVIQRMYSHLYRGVGLCLLSQEGTSFPCWLDTTGLKAHLASARVFIYARTYSTYPVRTWRGGGDDVDCDKSSLTKLGEWNLKTLRSLGSAEQTWPQQWTVLVKRVLWKDLELPEVLL